MFCCDQPIEPRLHLRRGDAGAVAGDDDEAVRSDRAQELDVRLGSRAEPVTPGDRGMFETGVQIRRPEHRVLAAGSGVVDLGDGKRTARSVVRDHTSRLRRARRTRGAADAAAPDAAAARAASAAGAGDAAGGAAPPLPPRPPLPPGSDPPAPLPLAPARAADCARRAGAAGCAGAASAGVAAAAARSPRRSSSSPPVRGTPKGVPYSHAQAILKSDLTLTRNSSPCVIARILLLRADRTGAHPIARHCVCIEATRSGRRGVVLHAFKNGRMSLGDLEVARRGVLIVLGERQARAGRFHSLHAVALVAPALELRRAACPSPAGRWRGIGCRACRHTSARRRVSGWNRESGCSTLR